jgi:hypothetical protein
MKFPWIKRYQSWCGERVAQAFFFDVMRLFPVTDKPNECTYSQKPAADIDYGELAKNTTRCSAKAAHTI